MKEAETKQSMLTTPMPYIEALSTSLVDWSMHSVLRNGEYVQFPQGCRWIFAVSEMGTGTVCNIVRTVTLSGFPQRGIFRNISMTDIHVADICNELGAQAEAGMESRGAV